MNNPLYTPSEAPSVIRVFQKSASIDGFSVELQNGEVIEITGTQWAQADNKSSIAGKVNFQNYGKVISFTHEQELLANKILGING